MQMLVNSSSSSSADPHNLLLNPVSSSGIMNGGSSPDAMMMTILSESGMSSNAHTRQAHLSFQVNKFCGERVAFRRSNICKNIRDVVKVVQDILKEVEIQEPRFISSLSEGCNNHFEGLTVHSPHEFEVILYLNQMGVFNFVDDGSLPGSSVLKLSDGRKRSMSLWVEFITASGYLSARKIRSRFQTLVASACDKSSYRDIVKMVPDSSEVRLRIRERFIVQITPGMSFRCSGLWPRSASHWPSPPGGGWPSPALVQEVKAEGFDLLSKESLTLVNKNSSSSSNGSSSGGSLVNSTTTTGANNSNTSGSSSMEGDAWVLSFTEAENRLLMSSIGRKKSLSMLKTLRDRHLDHLPGNPISSYVLKTLTLFECEKHPRDGEWEESAIGDRILGIFLQLISCLQSRRCPHYFLPAVDLFRGKSHSSLEHAAKQVWRLTRELLTNSRPFDKL